MTFADVVFARLRGDPAITAAVPGGWWPLRLPEGVTLPAGVFQRISAPRTYTHSGPVPLIDRRVQLDIYATGYEAGAAAMGVVAASLSGTVASWSGCSVRALIVDDGEGVDPDDRGLFRQRLDVSLLSSAP